MSTALMQRVEMAPSGLHPPRAMPSLSIDVVRVLRPLALFVLGWSLPVTLLPVLALGACLALPCLPFMLPLMVLGARGIPWLPRAHHSARRSSPPPAPRILRGRLWDARDFAVA